MKAKMLRSYNKGASKRSRQSRGISGKAGPFLGNAFQFEGESQQPARPSQAVKKLDDSLLTTKNPTADLDKDQRIAVSAETIPIVFGSRTNNKGGIWVQPSMVKAGSKAFVPNFLYAISQGEIVSLPQKYRAWVGAKKISNLKTRASISLTHSYSTAASISIASNICPIGGSTLYCGVETNSFYLPADEARSGGSIIRMYPATYYRGSATITLGIGDTGNCVYYAINSDIRYFRSDTGADITQAWNAYFNVSPSFEFIYNTRFDFSPGAPYLVVGSPVGYIVDNTGINSQETFVQAIVPNIEDDAYIVQVGVIDRVDNQWQPGLPASTGTLTGLQQERRESTYADLINTPGADNSAYADVTFLRISGDIVQFGDLSQELSLSPKQLYIYYAQGVKVDLYSAGLNSGTYTRGASNQLVDLAMYLFTIYKISDGANTAEIASPILTTNMTSIAQFCSQYSLFYNGVLEETVNIIDFLSSISPFFLLSLLSIGGQYQFQPLLPLNGAQIKTTALTPAATFNDDDILPGSFVKSYRDADSREDVVIVLIWRNNNSSQVGLQVTTRISFSSTAIDAPVAQYDMTNFCTSKQHATLYGKYELARRKHSTHSISFDTTIVVSGLKSTDIIKIERQRVTSKGDNRTETNWYQVTSIQYAPDGTCAIEADYFPVNQNDEAIINDTIINGSFEVA